MVIATWAWQNEAGRAASKTIMRHALPVDFILNFTFLDELIFKFSFVF
jgi:hypothetical protein